jgi:superfamily I DNA/RNA helicase
MIKYEDWKPSGGLSLEPNAVIAATSRDGNIALIAGPGAGKTEMLAQRADFLLRTGACSYPKRILAISFKRDASENLKKRVEVRCGKELASRFDSYTFHAFSKRIIDIFRPCLSGDEALDENYTIEKYRNLRTQITFNDMVPLANKIIDRCPVARNSIRQTYSHVFLDEFQDCTKTQYTLIKNAFLESNIRLIAVGDTKQKIMGWAGALEGVFLEFEKDFNAIHLNLYQNFRSLPRIRRVHNTMIRNIDPQAAVDDEQLTGDGGTVAIKNFPTEIEEANWIADSIQSWFDEGIALSEIAILCNTQPHLYAYHLMEELARRNIPFRNEQDVQDLFCEPIYRIIVDYLVVLLSSSEPDAWERLTSAIFPDDYEDISGIKTREWVQFIENQQSLLNGILLQYGEQWRG